MVHIEGFYSTYKRRRVKMFNRKRQTRWRSRKDKLADAREGTSSLTLEKR